MHPSRFTARTARRRARVVMGAVGCLATASLLGACGSSTPSSESPTAQASTSQTPAPATPTPLGFTAALVDGGQLDASTLANGQPVLFWFWAPY